MAVIAKAKAFLEDARRREEYAVAKDEIRQERVAKRAKKLELNRGKGRGGRGFER